MCRMKHLSHSITAVSGPQEGPIHDVQWSPSGDFFVTVAGFMPAKSTIFTAACKPHYDLGSGPHNMARWNPQAWPLSSRPRRACMGAAGPGAPVLELLQR